MMMATVTEGIATAIRDEVAPPRPKLRGVLHLITALLAPAGMVLLLLLADSPRGYVGASIYSTSVLLLYASSANYHLAPWPERLRKVMQRIDHSMIFVLIAGSYTPFCLIVLNNAWGIPMLSVVWTLAGVGVVVKNAWLSAPRWVGVSLYLALGWVGVVAAGPLMAELADGALFMLVLGGALYSVGAVVYAMRRPDPFPRVFGYHEVFHAFVIAGSAVHFALVAAYVG
jgi:hemolysin III